MDNELQQQQDIHRLSFVMGRNWYAHGCKVHAMSSTWIE